MRSSKLLPIVDVIEDGGGAFGEVGVAVHLRDGGPGAALVDSVRAGLEGSGLPPDRFYVEISERLVSPATEPVFTRSALAVRSTDTAADPLWWRPPQRVEASASSLPR